MQLGRWCIVGSLLGIAGCGAAAAPVPQIAAAEASIRAARERGAPGDLDASVYLGLAEKELRGAREKLRIGDEEAAERLALRAQADADVAEALASALSTRAAVRWTLDEVNALATELERPIPLPDPSPEPARAGAPSRSAAGIQLAPPRRSAP